MKHRVPLILFASLLISGCASYRIHPEFKERHPKILSMAVLPADFEVYRLSFKGDKDPMHDVTARANGVMADELSREIEKKGYKLQPMDFSEQALSQRPEVRSAWHTVKELHAKALSDFLKGRQKKFTYTLGPDVNRLADHAQCDALVLVKGEGVKKTGGEIAREVFFHILFGTGVMPSDTTLWVSFIDGSTGDLLWLNTNVSNRIMRDTDPDDSIKIRQLIQQLIRPFPKSAPLEAEEKARKGKKQPRQSAPASTPAGPAGLPAPARP